MKADERRLTSIGADQGEGLDDRWRRTSLAVIHLRARPSWLKDEKYVIGELTTKQARGLAVQLLEAAQRVDDMLADRPATS